MESIVQTDRETAESQRVWLAAADTAEAEMDERRYNNCTIFLVSTSSLLVVEISLWKKNITSDSRIFPTPHFFSPARLQQQTVWVYMLVKLISHQIVSSKIIPVTWHGTQRWNSIKPDPVFYAAMILWCFQWKYAIVDSALQADGLRTQNWKYITKCCIRLLDPSDFNFHQSASSIRKA